MHLKSECRKCQGCLHLGQVLHAGGSPSSQAHVPARLLNFHRWMTARFNLLKNVDLPLIGSREEPIYMSLSESMMLSSLQLNIYQMLSCKK